MKLLVLLSVVILCCQTGWATGDDGMCGPKGELPADVCIERQLMLTILAETLALYSWAEEYYPAFKEKCLDTIQAKGSYSCVCTVGLDGPKGKPLKLPLNNVAESSAQAFTACFKHIFKKNPSCTCNPPLSSGS